MLLELLKSLGRNFVEILSNRLQTLSLDLKEDRVRFIRLLLLGASAFFLLSLGTVFAVFWLVLAAWERNRYLVIGISTVTFSIVGAALVVVLVTRLRNLRGAFESTISEFDKDRAALGGQGNRGD
jgi:uncharacterized membrane protein YqjE